MSTADLGRLRFRRCRAEVLASTFATTAQEATVLDRDEDEDDQESPQTSSALIMPFIL